MDYGNYRIFFREEAAVLLQQHDSISGYLNDQLSDSSGKKSSSLFRISFVKMDEHFENC